MKDQNSFLYALSALGALSRVDYDQEFSNFCLETALSEDVDVYWQKIKYLKIMQSLGHIELDRNKEIVTCPPLFTIIRKKPHFLAVLTGARSPHLIQTIKDTNETFGNRTDIIEVEQKHPLVTGDVRLLLPDAIFIKSKTLEEINNLCEKVKIPCLSKKTAPDLLLEFAKGMDEYNGSLDWKYRENEDPKPAIKRTFSVQYLHFIEGQKISPDRLVEYFFPPYTRDVWIWHSGSGAAVHRDWGRYLLLHNIRKNILFYNPDSQWLAVPSNVQLPVLLSRAATLCSGLAPVEIRSGDISSYGLPRNTPFDVYFMVPQDIAGKIANLLGQELIRDEITPHADLCKLVAI